MKNSKIGFITTAASAAPAKEQPEEQQKGTADANHPAFTVMRALADLAVSNIDSSTAETLVPLIAAALATRSKDFKPESMESFKERAQAFTDQIIHLVLNVRHAAQQAQVEDEFLKTPQQAGEVGN